MLGVKRMRCWVVSWIELRMGSGNNECNYSFTRSKNPLQLVLHLLLPDGPLGTEYPGHHHHEDDEVDLEK